MKNNKSFPSSELLRWYEGNKRQLPWRETGNPYYIWLSEIILQQTRVEQGTPYFERFVSTFPTVEQLANASEDEVLKLWEGLGYYSRARNLHATAKLVARGYGGEFPSTYAGLLSLKGVGPYTAAAIGSIAFDLPVAAVDGNVYRVMARFFGITDSIDETSTKKHITELANCVLDTTQPGNHNQAVMELGATVCTPKQPKCESCPMNSNCVANAQGLQAELPVRSKKVKVRNRYFYYIVSEFDGKLPVKRRGEGDIWQGLYEFPMLETDQALTELKLVEKAALHSDDVIISISAEFKHILSHQRIYSQFILVKHACRPSGDHLWVSLADLRNFAFPRLINRYLESSSFVFDAEVSNI